MATANPLEDGISCSICFEIYRDPHLLRECLHTFCNECIQPLIQRGRVECPECQEVTETKHIKKDFKTQKFIDAYHRQQEDSGRERHMIGIRCGMCEESKPIKSQCSDCENYMCAQCEKIHSNLKQFKTHKVKQMKEIIKGYESILRSDITDLEVENKNVQEKSISFDWCTMNIEIARKKQLSDVKQYTENAIKELTENQHRLENMINNANSNLITYIKEAKQICDQTVKDIQIKVEMINDLLKSQDVNTLIETANSVHISIREDIQNMKAKLISVDRNKMISPVTVTRGRKWNAKSCVEIEVKDISACNKQDYEVPKGIYSDLHKSVFTESNAIDLDYWPEQLCMVNEEMWCAGNSAVYVYNKDCALLKKITHEKIKGANTLTYCDKGHVIIGCICRNGLHQLDSRGKYETQIAEGGFSDTCYHQGLLYALEHNSCTIKVLKYTGNWVHIKVIKLQYSNGSNWDRICVHVNGIHVSSWHNKCVYRYTIDGSIQGSLSGRGTQQPGEFVNPCLCDVDSDNNVIVSDWDSNTLQMLDDVGNWHMIQLPGLEKSDRIRSLLRENEYLWIATWKMTIKRYCIE